MAHAQTTSGPRLDSQAKYLSALASAHKLSAREIARRSNVIAKELGKPEMAVGHHAVSGWLNGTRHPSTIHQQFLATILSVSLEDIALACIPETQCADTEFVLKPITVDVPKPSQTYRYNLTIRKEINLNQPAIYRDWGSMFGTPPTCLNRHFRRVHYESYGWIPDNSASPMVHYPGCLVPVKRLSERHALQQLDLAESSRRRVWFVYLPDGQLHVGLGYRKNQSLIFARTEGSRIVVQDFQLRRVDLVGYFTGSIIFHLVPPVTTSNGHRTPNERIQPRSGNLENSKTAYMSENAHFFATN